MSLTLTFFIPHPRNIRTRTFTETPHNTTKKSIPIDPDQYDTEENLERHVLYPKR
jgi:hypothetical protein